MGDPSGQRGRFCDFTHLKAVFHRWVTAPMLLHPFCTSCSILVKLIGLMYEQNPLVQRLRLMSEFSMISGMSRAETKARFPPLFISLFQGPVQHALKSIAGISLISVGSSLNLTCFKNINQHCIHHPMKQVGMVWCYTEKLFTQKTCPLSENVHFYITFLVFCRGKGRQIKIKL